jgi:hypothetical protein
MTQQQMENPPFAPAGLEAKAGLREQGGALRSRVFKKGKLIHLNNRTVFDCMVREIHQDGALLSCGDTTMLPTEMRLAIPSNNEVRHVRIVWRRPREMWVRFLEAPQPVLTLVI